MGEKPKKSMMDDIRETAELVKQSPPYLRTQSSRARAERDLRERGIDPHTGRAVGSPAVRGQLEMPAGDESSQTQLDIYNGDKGRPEDTYIGKF